jgi:hypothetical protein
VGEGEKREKKTKCRGSTSLLYVDSWWGWVFRENLRRKEGTTQEAGRYLEGADVMEGFQGEKMGSEESTNGRLYTDQGKVHA